MSKITILTADNNDVIHGIVPFLAPRGLGVTLDPANTGQLVKAEGRKPYFLERDVVEAIPLEARIFNNTLVMPVERGQTATARRAIRIAVEGADHIVMSGTGAIDGSTPVETEIGFHEGKIRVKQSGDDLAGVIEGKEPVEEEGNTFRLIIALDR